MRNRKHGTSYKKEESPSSAIKKKLLRKSGIRTRLMVSFLVLSIIPLLCIGILAISMSRKAVENKIESYSTELLKITGDNLDIQTSKILEVNKEISLSDLIQKDLPILDDMDKLGRNQKIQEIGRYLTNKFINNDKVLCSVILSNQGIIFKYGSTNLLSSEEWEDIKKAITESSDGGREFKILSTGKKAGNTNAFVYGNNIAEALTGEQIGVMITVVDEKYLSEGYRDVQIAKGSHVYVVNGAGLNISSVNEDEIGKAAASGDLMSRIKKSAESNKSFHYDNALVSAQVLNPSGWFLVSEIPYTYLYKESDTIRNNVIFSIAVCVMISVFAAWTITRSITIPLSRLTDVMKKARDGDLTIYLTDGNKDEVAGLFLSFNYMIGNIRDLIFKVRSSAKKVTEGAAAASASANESLSFTRQVADTMQQIAAGSSVQAASSVEGVGYMGNLSDDIIKVADIMNGVSDSMAKTKSINERIQNHIGVLNEKALQTSEITKKVVSDIGELEISMKEIEKTTRLIETVSGQTTLLSLNASIEAARAGEAGRSFAVVAEEIKKLSDQSRNASMAIGALLRGIKDKTVKTAAQAGNAITIVNEQTEAVRIANDSFEEIFKAMGNITNLMRQMSQCVDKMTVSKDKVSGAIANISSVAQEFAASSEEASASAGEQISSSMKLSGLADQINEMAADLNKMIMRFKVS